MRPANQSHRPRTPISDFIIEFLRNPERAWDLVRSWATAALPTLIRFGLLAAGALLLWMLAVSVVRHLHARQQREGTMQVVILSPPTPDLDQALTLWSTLHVLIRSTWWLRLRAGRPRVVFEYTWTRAGLEISLWVPGTIDATEVAGAVEATFPGSRTIIRDPRPPLPQDAPASAGASMQLAEPEWFGLRTDYPSDPLRPLLGAASALASGEAACVQLVAQPALPRRLRRCWKAAQALRTGKTTSASLLSRVLDLVTPTAAPSTPPPITHDPARHSDLKAILSKLASRPAFSVTVRLGTTGHNPHLVESRLHAMASGFGIFRDRNRLRRRKLRRPPSSMAVRQLGRGQLLTVAELGALAHLPYDPIVPGLARAGAKAVAPPPTLATSGLVLGDAEAGLARPIALTPADLRHHLHVMGATGVGKSTVLANLVLGAAANGQGAVVVDPRGDLIRELLARLPRRVADRVVVLDPTDQQPPALNVLEGDNPNNVADNTVGIFARVFAASWGSRMDDILRAGCLTLLQRPGATMPMVPRLFTDSEFRRPYVANTAGDPAGLGGFWAWYEGLTPAGQAHAVGPLLARLRQFLLRPFIRSVFGQPVSSFAMREVLDGGLLLVSAPQGLLGDATSRLLGSFVVAQVWQAASHRAALPERDRRDALLVLDEAANFMNLPYHPEAMLVAARGYHLGMVLAHQHLGQLTSELRAAVLTNARSMLWFVTSPEDAVVGERQVAPILSAHDLSHLGAYQAAARLVADGVEQPACTLRTRPLPPPIPGRAELIRARARTNYGRSPVDSAHAQLAGQVEPFPTVPDDPEPSSE